MVATILSIFCSYRSIGSFRVLSLPAADAELFEKQKEILRVKKDSTAIK